MILLNGKVSNKALLEKLSPDDIESVNVIRVRQAIKLYKAAQGVIIITTTKVKKE
jgi:hypothetical protein